MSGPEFSSVGMSISMAWSTMDMLEGEDGVSRNSAVAQASIEKLRGMLVVER